MASDPAADVPLNPHTPGTVAWVNECKRRLAEPFPADLIEEKNGLAYLRHEVIRQRLIEATGNCFDWTIDQILFRDDGVTRRAIDPKTKKRPAPSRWWWLAGWRFPSWAPGPGLAPIPSMPAPARMRPTRVPRAMPSNGRRWPLASGLLSSTLKPARRSGSRRHGHSAERRRSSGSAPAWQTEWQARIDAALAMPNGTGKSAWQQLVAEAIAAKCEERLAMLVDSARSPEGAEAILRHATRHGLRGPAFVRSHSAQSPSAPVTALAASNRGPVATD